MTEEVYDCFGLPIGVIESDSVTGVAHSTRQPSFRRTSSRAVFGTPSCTRTTRTIRSVARTETEKKKEEKYGSNFHGQRGNSLSDSTARAMVDAFCELVKYSPVSSEMMP